jgi:hypothetical protein
MVKQLFFKDFKNYKSPGFQNLFNTSAGLAANQKMERATLVTALKTGISSYPGNPTKAIALAMGIIEKNPSFSRPEILEIKKGLKECGFFVPRNSIKEDPQLRSRFSRNNAENKTDYNSKDINQQVANRESNARFDKPMRQSYESRLQTIAKIPGQPHIK